MIEALRQIFCVRLRRAALTATSWLYPAICPEMSVCTNENKELKMANAQ
jgi:hypothetical protein